MDNTIHHQLYFTNINFDYVLDDLFMITDKFSYNDINKHTIDDEQSWYEEFLEDCPTNEQDYII